MTASRLLATLLVSGLTLAACGSAPPRNDGADDTSDNATDPCDGVVDLLAGDPLTCAHAVELANERLGLLHWPVSSVEFRWGLCPPNARCGPNLGHNGVVVYQFWFGDPVMVLVHRAEDDLRTDGFTAEDPEPLPDWLLEEMGLRPAAAWAVA